MKWSTSNRALIDGFVGQQTADVRHDVVVGALDHGQVGGDADLGVLARLFQHLQAQPAAQTARHVPGHRKKKERKEKKTKFHVNDVLPSFLTFFRCYPSSLHFHGFRSFQWFYGTDWIIYFSLLVVIGDLSGVLALPSFILVSLVLT